METGVPQGTILASILFSIYVLELCHVVQKFDASCHFYADATQNKLIIAVDDEEEARRDFRLILEVILGFMSIRRLNLTPDKTECIMF